MIASKKAKKSEDRSEISQQADLLISQLNKNLAWQSLDKKEQIRLTSLAQQCAQIFQRSSSCLEGRNGYLSLRHHGLHHISDRKLGALTVIHNYFIIRPDGTTAAERFFDQKTENLFEKPIDTDLDNENLIRKENLKQYNYVFKNKNSTIEDLEKIPAYKRMGIEINDQKSNNEDILSKTILNEDNKLEFPNVNTYLHDNVD